MINFSIFNLLYSHIYKTMVIHHLHSLSDWRKCINHTLLSQFKNWNKIYVTFPIFLCHVRCVKWAAFDKYNWYINETQIYSGYRAHNISFQYINNSVLIWIIIHQFWWYIECQQYLVHIRIPYKNNYFLNYF